MIALNRQARQNLDKEGISTLCVKKGKKAQNEGFQ